MLKFNTYILIFFLCFLTWTPTLYAQNKNGKFSSINKVKIDRDAVEKNLHYAESIFEDSLSTALTIIENNLIIAIENKFKSEEALAYRILGDFNQTLSNYDLAISNYEKSIHIYKNEDNYQELFRLYSHIGHIEFILFHSQKSISAYKKALDIAIKLKSTIKEVISMHHIAEVYLRDNNTKDARTLYLKGFDKAIQINNSELIIKSNIGLGKTAQLEGENTTAEQYYKEAQSLSEELDFDYLTNESFNLLTNLYNQQNNNQQGLEIQQQAYDYNSFRGNNNSILENSTNISLNYVEQGKTKEALDVLNESTSVLSLEENTEAKRDFIKVLSDIYAKQGFMEKSDLMINKYNQLIDSFNLENENQEKIQASKSEYLQGAEDKILLMEKDRQLNEKMIDILKREQEVNNATIKRQVTTTYFLVGGLIVFGIMAFFLYRSSRQKQKVNQLLVLKSLRNQMNPHFIFNSLNSVNSFIAKKDERSANKYLAEFSKLMREVLECSQQDFIPLAKEVEILKLYLNLEHFRFNSHFDFKFNVDKSINLDEYQIPPMLLQPFIENAIWHGLRYKKDKGELIVSFQQKENHVEIMIKDDGIGREQSKLSKTLNQKKMKSTGIKNVESRLELIRNVFKKDSQITIDDLDKETKKGTIITLKLY